MRSLMMLLLVLGLACQTDEPAPAAPIGGIGGPGGSTGSRDSGTGSDGGAADSAARDGGATPTCVEVMPGDVLNRALVTQGGVDVSFVPRRAFVTYNPNRCDTGDRELVLVLTEDDNCTLGIGRRVVFVIDTSEIGDGLVPVGTPIQIAFTAGLSMLFIQPAAGGATVWGNCSTESDGNVTWEFLDAAAERQSGAFTATLVDCADTPTQAPVVVTGAIDVPLGVTFEDVCDSTPAP